MFEPVLASCSPGRWPAGTHQNTTYASSMRSNHSCRRRMIATWSGLDMKTRSDSTSFHTDMFTKDVIAERTQGGRIPAFVLEAPDVAGRGFGQAVYPFEVADEVGHGR